MLVAAGLVAGACTAGPHPPPPVSTGSPTSARAVAPPLRTPLPTSRARAAGDDTVELAVGEGRLDVAGACTSLRAADGTHVGLLWPVGWSVDRDAVYESRGRVVARDGDLVSLDGGAVGAQPVSTCPAWRGVFALNRMVVEHPPSTPPPR